MARPATSELHAQQSSYAVLGYPPASDVIGQSLKGLANAFGKAMEPTTTNGQTDTDGDAGA